MAKQVILLDTSILIDFYRKKNKEKSKWFELLQTGKSFAVSVITQYELLTGCNQEQMLYWNRLFNEITVLPLDSGVVMTSVDINARLKLKRKQIAIADLFIAATAVHYNLTIATLNKSHFERIESLQMHQ